MKIGRSISFAAKDSGGVLRTGRGTLLEIGRYVLTVRLSKNWWGSYLKGQEVRVYPDEVEPRPKKHRQSG